jgi:hypothetical protein
MELMLNLLMLLLMLIQHINIDERLHGTHWSLPCMVVQVRIINRASIASVCKPCQDIAQAVLRLVETKNKSSHPSSCMLHQQLLSLLLKASR